MTAFTPTLHPIPFQPSFEQIPDDEAHTTQELLEALQSVADTTLADYSFPVRSVHAKAHGLLRGELEVLDNLPAFLAQGAFARHGRLPVVMRFSTTPGDLLDDHVSTPRGLALKVIGVEGERLPGSEGEVTQDFVLVNAKAFNLPTPKAFVASLKLLAKTTDKAPGLKRAFSAVLRGVESTVEAMVGESAALRNLGGHPITHVLGETFSTLVPLLYGPYFGKVQVVPVSPALVALTGQHVELGDNPDGLRAAVSEFFAAHEGVWEVRVQLATDLDFMPIEDASAEWPEELSPFVAVARIVVPQQASWSAEREVEIDQRMAFSPWHGLAAHRPLGGVMRVRKPAYEQSAGFRGVEGCPVRA
jgi:hypothetical protein